MKQQTIITTLLLFLTIVATTKAQVEQTSSVDLTTQVPIDPNVRMGKLDNGITYYLRANKMPEGRVHFRLVVNAGSVLEEEDQRGLAHFVEHMAFNGTEYYEHNELINKLQEKGVRFGGHVNARTSFDETVYYVNMPNDAEMLDMGMKILDGWASKLLMDPDEIEAERGVILEEWRGRLGAQYRMLQQYYPIVLKDCRYANRIPIGTEEVIKNFKRPTIMRFYEHWYRPDLQAVIIVGDFDVDEMEVRVKEYFNDNKMPANPIARPTYPVPDNKEPLIAVVTDKEASEASLMMAWKHLVAPSITIGDFRQELIQRLVKTMLNARLGDITERPSAPFLNARASYSTFIGREVEAFMLGGTSKENRIDETTELLLAEMKRADEHGFLASELNRAKESLYEQYRGMLQQENNWQNDFFAEAYTYHYLEGGMVPGIRQEEAYVRELVPSITLAEVNAEVKRWVTDQNLVVILTAPEREGYKVPTQEEILSIINKSKSIKTQPWVDEYNDEPLFTLSVPTASYKETKSNDVLGYTEYTCSNGIRFVVKKTNWNEDDIQLKSFSYGGSSLYSDSEAFMTSKVADIVRNAGVGNFSANQLSKKLKGSTVYLTPRILSSEQGFAGNCAPKNLEVMLQLLNLYYVSPRKDRESYDRYIEELQTKSRASATDPKTRLLVDLTKKAYNNNPRIVTNPTDKDIATLDYDRIYQIFHERFNDASGQIFIFVGNILDQDIQLIANYINILPCSGKQKNEPLIDTRPRMAPGINRSLTQAGIDNQGVVYIAGETEGFDGGMKERLTLDLLNEVVQLFTTEVIREKMGEAYSPYAGVHFNPFFGGMVSWRFILQCAPENCASVESAALNIIRQIVKNGCDKNTLEKARLQLLNDRETDKQQNNFWMGAIYSEYYGHEDNNPFILEYEKVLNSITVKDIKKMARKYFDLNHYTVGTLIPENR